MQRRQAAKPTFFAMSMIMAIQGARANDDGRPDTFQAVVACRTINQTEARLACYDQSVAAMDEAEQRNQLVVIDRQQVNRAERGIFGLSLPSVSAIFRRSSDKTPHEEIKQIESALKQVSPAGYGKWTFALEDGGTWATTEAVTGRVPKVGEHIIVKRASLGGYVLSADGGRAVRVKRLN